MTDGKYSSRDSADLLESRFKIGLRQLFYAITLIAAGLALSSSTIWFSLFILLGWSLLFFSSRPKLVLGLIFLAIIIVLACLPTVQASREAPRHAECLNNIKNFAIAILNYESAHGKFPTDRIVTLADGTELRHSWRIVILPFLEQQRLFDKYDFNEHWNGPNNSKLETSMPYYFGCRSKRNDTTTTYKLVNGPGTAFEAGKKLGVKDLDDGTFNTIALIEDQTNPQHWMEPGVFTAEEAADAMNAMTRKAPVHRYNSFFSTTYFGSSIAMIDGSAHWWSPMADQKMMPGAFLIDDGYLFDLDAQGQPYTVINYAKYFALFGYGLLILLPAFFLDWNRQRESAIR